MLNLREGMENYCERISIRNRITFFIVIFMLLAISINEIQQKIMLFCMKDISKKHKFLLMTQIIAASGVLMISLVHVEYQFNSIYHLIDIAAFFSLNQFDNYIAYFLEVALEKDCCSKIKK